MNYRVADSLELFAALVFDKSVYGKQQLVVVDENMVITEVSEAASDLFAKNMSMFQYNSAFSKIFSDLNYVCNFRLRVQKVELDSMLTDFKILKHYETYFEFLNGQEMEIKDKNGENRFLLV